MENFIEIIGLPFMQRALMGGIMIGFLLALLGVFVTLRKMSFFGDGVAHASLAGIAIGIIAAYNPLFVAIIFSIIFASLIFYLEKKTSLSPDAIIGILFPSFMALGILLISFKSGYQPELISFLFGNILAIKSSELLIMAVFSVIVFLFIALYYRQITFLSFDEEGAKVSGINIGLLDLVFYIALSVSIVLGVKILGIILVSALLIIPASTAKLLSKSFKSLVWISLIVSQISVIMGIFISYWLNLPTGTTIVLLGSALFFLALLYRRFN